MKQLTIIYILIFGNVLISQNLVLNSSFEVNNECPWHIGAFASSVSDWSIPNMGSTDVFSGCTENKNTGVKNYNGYQKAKSGDAYAGVYVYTDKNYREYIQGTLSQTLKQGEKYKMTFYLSLADKSSYALKDIQVLITEEQLKPCYKSNNCEKAIKPSKSTKGEFKIYSNSEDIYFSDKKSWMEYAFEFTAEGYENYFSIGNFYRNPKTKKQKVLSTSTLFFSYYYIDDVSIEPIEKRGVKPSLEVIEKPQIKVNEIYRFNNVLFDFDKSELLEVSIHELDELYGYLKENSDLSIEIYGHTDNVGLNKRNKELSKERAKAVADYLISQGLDMSRIQSIGFGSSKPVSTNETEEGRQQNRRVEFKIIDN
ncbi:OmpA family protein [uncultured Winogradskyella sp.]|uniref:OmpA family protein n=1 Tax=uncultured Winogradskyella sp. TaxID=395353 RepID=UPI00262B0846|nr:OmpA family protein [uncultured Winogradskyella sp.]